jgi:hypothetical protein
VVKISTARTNRPCRIDIVPYYEKTMRSNTKCDTFGMTRILDAMVFRRALVLAVLNLRVLLPELVN